MGLVTFIILFGPAMEYSAPNMTPSASHVTQKNENHGQNGLNFRLHGQNTSTRCDICHVTLRVYVPDEHQSVLKFKTSKRPFSSSRSTILLRPRPFVLKFKSLHGLCF